MSGEVSHGAGAGAGAGAGLAAAEALYLEARDLHDRLEVNRARGFAEPRLEGLARAAAQRARRAVGELRADRERARTEGPAVEPAGLDPAGLDPAGLDEARALTAMSLWLAEVPDPDEPGGSVPDGRRQGGDGFEGLAGRIMADYAAVEGAVDAGGERLTRLAVLGRLGEEDDPVRRRRLFLALEPVWRSIAGDGGPGGPYRRLLRLSAGRWANGGSPVAANARALGLDPASIEPALVGILEAWREAAAPSDPVEPWDFWHWAGVAGGVPRAAVPLEELLPVTRAYHAALGADLDGLGAGFDITPRPGRPPVPVAYATFGGRPRRGPGGRWSGARPWVFASYTGGGLGELTELIHEAGHAIHIAGVATRPAFADWPDSDAFTEALADLLALDTAEPAWQERWLGVAAPERESLRGRYAEVVLDVCWALLEIRLHAAPDRSPDDVWAELTSTYLGIAVHPEWPWWAMRGQLADAPGYMSNYAIGPILAADLRAAIRAARGDWTAGDPGWYAWVRDRVYRWGLARSSGEVLRSVLGRAPTPDALLAEIGRAGAAGLLRQRPPGPGGP